QVWVMLGLNFPGDETGYDPRNDVIITDEQCEYLAYEFDNT
ncbi:unnamed protein product, partial [marine sediment metagenome]